jgi:hypothetical protein
MRCTMTRYLSGAAGLIALSALLLSGRALYGQTPAGPSKTEAASKKTGKEKPAAPKPAKKLKEEDAAKAKGKKGAGKGKGKEDPLSEEEKNALEEQEEKENLAKEHFLKGKALVEEGAWKKAIIELKASYELNPNPVVLYNIGICYDELTRYAEAVEYYSLFLEEAGDKFKEVMPEVQLRVDELSKFLGILKLQVNVEGAEIMLDGNLMGLTPLEELTIETGEHDLVIRKQGYHEIARKVTIVSGQTVELAFTLKQDEPRVIEEPVVPPKPSRKTLNPAWFWSMVGLTAAAGGAAIVTGALAVKKDRDVEGYYSDEDWQSVADEGKKLALSTDILIGVTAAAGAGALILLFFTDFKKPAEKEKKTGALAPSMGAKGIMINYEVDF